MKGIKTIVGHALNNADDALDLEFQDIVQHRTIISPPLSEPVTGPTWADFEGAGAYLTAENSTIEINALAAKTELKGGSSFNDMLGAPDGTTTKIGHNNPSAADAWSVLVRLPISKLGNIPADPVSMVAAVTHKGTSEFAFSNTWRTNQANVNDLPISPISNLTINSGTLITENISGGSDADWPPDAATINSKNGLMVYLSGFCSNGVGVTEIDAIKITMSF